MARGACGSLGPRRRATSIGTNSPVHQRHYLAPALLLDAASIAWIV
jgi:hypothetical protein